MNWEPPLKPAELAETRLINAILGGRFPIDSSLPAERELATMLGVTRPTLREALQRMARDGWIDIHHGRSTRVKNYWQEGNLGVLSAIVHQPQHAPPDFVPNLLRIRLLMAPDYTCQAVAAAQGEVSTLLAKIVEVDDHPEEFARVDWKLHHRLTILSGNPIFTLILNGFEELYGLMAVIYFQSRKARQHSRSFYRRLYEATQNLEIEEVELITRQTMADSLDLWDKVVNANTSWANLLVQDGSVEQRDT
jgi:GntR family negative regulator for fad regulon and positive regulator of fabA